MKKYLLLIGAVILAGTTWLFSVKPNPPFGGELTPSLSVDNRVINFIYTDDNSNENLLIYSDKNNYNNSEVYFAVKNNSGKEQNLDIVFTFSKLNRDLDIQRYVTNTQSVINEDIYETITTATTSYQGKTKLGTRPIIKNTNWININKTTTYSKTTNLKKIVRGDNHKSFLDILGIGEIAYYKASFKNLIGSNNEEFFIEAFGDKSGYGHLDPTLTDNIVSYWKLDEGSGDAADSVGSNTGTTANITYQAGKINNGFSFNGTTSTVNMGTTATLNTNAFTIAAWAKFTNFTPAYTQVIGRQDASTGSPYAVLLVKSNGKLACYLLANADVSYDGTGSHTLSPDTWYYLVMTYDSTNGLICYVDGSSDGTAAANGNAASYTGNFTLGYRKAGTDDRFITGMIDEAAYWSRTLTSSEITQLYNSGAGLQYPFTGNATVSKPRRQVIINNLIDKIKFENLTIIKIEKNIL